MKEAKLCIEMSGSGTGDSRVRIEVLGTEEEILFNWTALTSIVCQKAHVAPEHLAIMLPRMIDSFTKTAPKFGMEIDLSALRNYGREGRQ